MRRTRMKREAQAESAIFDVVIIGGGASGAWLALDSASRGLKTLLVEQYDFAACTSSRSTKLIHGGLRYLRRLDIGLVRESQREKNLLLHMAGDFITPLKFQIPCFSPYETLKYKAGLRLYDFLSQNEKSSGAYSREEMVSKSPNLHHDKVHSLLTYFDAGFDDSRFAIELLKKAFTCGACLLNYTRLDFFIYDAKHKIIGARIKDQIDFEEFEVYGKTFINATGPFTDIVRKINNPSETKIMCLSRGSHIVVDSSFLGTDEALLIPKTVDGRVVFMIPWKGKTLIGTTEEGQAKPEKDPAVTPEEVSYLLSTVRQFLRHGPEEKDIISRFAGIRPLVRRIPHRSSKILSRRHEILIESTSKLVTLTGGKWTTSRLMAEETLNRMMAHDLLPFRPSITSTLLIQRLDNIPSLPVSEETLKEKIHYYVKEEMATCIEDILSRRERLLFLDPQRALQLAPKVAEILKTELEHEYPIEQDEKAFTKIVNNYCPQSVRLS